MIIILVITIKMIMIMIIQRKNDYDNNVKNNNSYDN